MNYAAKKISVEPTNEPVTLSEAKDHLRLDSTTFAGSITTQQSIAPGDHVVAASYSLKGTGIDVLGSSALVILNSGANGSGGTVDAKIQESDTDVDGDYTDWSGGAFTQVTEANDNAVQEKEYTGSKQYIRAVATVANATCDFGVSVIEKDATLADDDYLTRLLTTSRRKVENYLNRALITQTWNVYLNDWPREGVIKLPLSPVQSITSITYTNAGDSSEYSNTWSSSEYTVDTDSYISRVVLGYGYTFPSSTLGLDLPIRIIQVCGYGATASTVPRDIRDGILWVMEYLYEKRGSQRANVIRDSGANSLLDNYRIWP